jgi:hypothetical protein
MPPADAAALARSVLSKPFKFRADTPGRRLRLTQDERAKLAITTIGAFDLDAQARKALRKQRRRAADQLRRKRMGAKSRQEHEAGSLARSKPWEAHGISRSTWYRCGKPPPE